MAKDEWSPVELLDWLERWYLSQCDGDWEHQHGIRIETTDNPGWSVQIDLEETELAKLKSIDLEASRSRNDWIWCRIDNGTFKGAGGPRNLSEVLSAFCKWTET